MLGLGVLRVMLALGVRARDRARATGPILLSLTYINYCRIELRDKEWRERVVDEEFQPFSRRSHPPYEPLLHTSSPYKPPNLHPEFRAYQPHNHISHKPFRAPIQPLATFDELRSSI